MTVCSLVRANAVRLRVQIRPSPIQIFRPSCRFLFFFSFLSVAKPEVLASFSPPLELAATCMCSTLLSLSAAPALEKSPPGFPFLLFVSLLSSVANQSLRESFSCLRPAREGERVKFSAIHPFSSKIREFSSSLSRKISVISQQ